MAQSTYQKQLAEMLRKAQERSAMLSQSAMTPEALAAAMQQAGYDPAGKEAMLATMLRGGQEAVYSDMPQGRMMGSVYANPSWSESLNGAAKKLVGGYQMGQARKEQTDIDAKRATATAAESQVTAEAARAKQQQAADAEVAKLVTAQGTAADRQAAMDQRAKQFEEGQSRQDARFSRSLAARGPGGTSGGRPSYNEPVRYIDPYSGNEIMASFNKAANRFGNPVTGEEYTPEQMKGYVREDAMTEGQREKAVTTFIEKNKDTFGLMHDIESAQDTWQANGMQPGENPFNWFTKQAGALGDMSRSLADVGKKGNPTQDDYAAAQTVINTISRLRAGLSQTANELSRIKTETGQDAMVSPEVFIKYWDRLKGKVGNDIAMANKAVSPRTLQAYQRWEGQKTATGAPDIGTDGNFTPTKGGGLTPEEQKELEALEAQFGGGP
jgi:hypothetical protein